ncbi:MAG: TolB family protein, partial [Longimicrobiales bacterium]
MITARHLVLAVIASALATAPAAAQAPARAQAPAPAQTALKPLDHDAYDIWNRIAESTLSDDGGWVVYATQNERDGSLLHARSLANEAVHRVERAEDSRISEDSRWVVALIKPMESALEQARIEKAKQQPQDSLAILDLSTGAVVRVARVKSFELPEAAAGWVAYLHGEPAAESDTVRADSAAAMPEPHPVTGNVPPTVPGGVAPEAEQDTAGTPVHDKDEGTLLVLRNLATGVEQRFADVVWYDFSKNGRRLVYAASNEDGSADGVYVVDVASGSATPVMTGEGHYRQVAIDEAGEQIAFVSDHDDFAADQPAYTLYHWQAGEDVRPIAATGNRALPADWWVSEHGEVRFSHDGTRIFFGTAPRPAPADDDEKVDPDDVVKVDVWNWQD